ncbi:MAG: indole-3-glycerol phosphate synthase TrpC [Candidatus Puniceispirillaceae bacterium]
MRDVLAEINAHKQTEITALKDRISLSELESQAKQADAPRGFAKALKKASESGYGLIAELKKASPSKGLIRADFDPVSLAKAYEDGGATCLSILTDERYFQGHKDFLVSARAAVSLPVLRKDFMIDPVQIIEARSLGADCILLIMASLSDNQALELEAVAHEWGMDVLIEVHDESELERACLLSSPLMGINNRNLKTMQISLDVGAAMLPRLPDDRIAVAESGLFSPDDLTFMASHGARCFLIGESLMRQDDVCKATKAILANPVAA